MPKPSNPICEELLPPCHICGKIWKRKDVAHWLYHESIGVVCRHHHGIQEWYDNLLKEIKEKLIKDGVILE
jgi:hypothetical protein